MGTTLPLGSMSSSARKPSGPTATLVGIPKKICLEGFNDFLDLLSEERSILRLKGKIKPMSAWHQTSPLHSPTERLNVLYVTDA